MFSREKGSTTVSLVIFWLSIWLLPAPWVDEELAEGGTKGVRGVGYDRLDLKLSLEGKLSLGDAKAIPASDKGLT